MLDLIEVELTRVRKMAEHAGDEFLLYLIDMAIIEANAKARSRRESPELAHPVALTRDDCGFSPRTTPEFQVVH